MEDEGWLGLEFAHFDPINRTAKAILKKNS
jgi:hypothetical protein